jgi:hypothetical protein
MLTTTADLDMRDRNLNGRSSLNDLLRVCLATVDLEERHPDWNNWPEQREEFAAQVFAI